ncbi:hypothetical protein [Georgenia sp. Z1491]|uniref:hypothetical protein n=1 Tax=Georgenia sp. Z1491 TaxID=3416707 RepID=UPI003CF4A071
MTTDPSRDDAEFPQDAPAAGAGPMSHEDPTAARLERRRITQADADRASTRNRYWLVAVIVAAAVSAAYFGFTWAEVEAANGGADEQVATDAGVAAALAALLGVLGVGLLLLALVVRGRAATRITLVVAALVSLAVAAVLALWVYPAVLDG